MYVCLACCSSKGKKSYVYSKLYWQGPIISKIESEILLYSILSINIVIRIFLYLLTTSLYILSEWGLAFVCHERQLVLKRPPVPFKRPWVVLILINEFSCLETYFIRGKAQSARWKMHSGAGIASGINCAQRSRAQRSRGQRDPNAIMVDHNQSLNIYHP